MKKVSRYLTSLVLSVLLVFSVSLSAIIIVSLNMTAEKAVKLAEKNNIYSTVYDELDKYFSKQYNTTGIPKEVYMDAIDEMYIKQVSDTYTEYLFDTLYYGSPQTTFDEPFYSNHALEDSITAFFNDYAEKNGYEKNEAFTLKLSTTINDAFKVICNYCDIYKYSSMNTHGVLSKISVVFQNMKTIRNACITAVILIMILIFIVNIKEKTAFLYWTGISSIISGTLGTVPCVYLIRSQYFDAFTIKQPQVFTAFTSAMYSLTEYLLKAEIGVIAVGILLTFLYGIIKIKKSQ